MAGPRGIAALMPKIRRYLPDELFEGVLLVVEVLAGAGARVEGEVFEAMLPRSFLASARALSSSALACFLHADFSLPFWSSHFSLATS